MKIDATSFAGYQKPVMQEVKKENCTSFILEGYGLKTPVVQLDCYEKGFVVKHGGAVQGVYAKNPKIDDMVHIIPSANLTDRGCSTTIAKYSAIA